MNIIASLCNFPGSAYLLFSNNVSPLLYYSHLPIFIISLILGIFILTKAWKNLPNQILFFITFFFSIWVFFDSAIWASNRSDAMMFMWTLQILFEPLVHIGCLYLVYVLINKKDAPFISKLIVGILYLPVIIFVPTTYGLSSFDLVSCLSIEGPIALYYTYSIEVIFSLWLIIYSVWKYKILKEKDKHKEVVSLALGAVLLLFSFSLGNIISSFSEDWRYAQIGLFAMPLFIGFLIYSIIRFKTFNIKLVAAQALVIAIIILVGSQFFFIRNPVNRTLTAISLGLIVIFGWQLVKTVKSEIASRDALAISNTSLQSANERLKKLDESKSEFLSIASHQLRTPLTGIKGYLSMILEGDYGPMTPKVKPVIENVFQESDRMTRLVNIFLNVSRIESGKFIITRKDTNFVELVKEVLKTLKLGVEQKKLELVFHEPKTLLPLLKVDGDKIKDVMSNLIDNAIKYTPKGKIEIFIEQIGQAIKVMVKDTGIGIPKGEDRELFKKFVRGEGVAQINTGGSGLGLFIVKKIVEAHGGKVWEESEGKGMGSSFIFTLPMA